MYMHIPRIPFLERSPYNGAAKPRPLCSTLSQGSPVYSRKQLLLLLFLTVFEPMVKRTWLNYSSALMPTSIMFSVFISPPHFSLFKLQIYVCCSSTRQYDGKVLSGASSHTPIRFYVQCFAVSGCINITSRAIFL